MEGKLFAYSFSTAYLDLLTLSFIALMCYISLYLILLYLIIHQHPCVPLLIFITLSSLTFNLKSGHNLP